MKKRAPVLLSVVASALVAQREDATFASGPIGKRLVRLAEHSRAVGFSGAILAAKGGAVVAAVGVGSADLEGMKPNTPSTLFEIASLSKQFTAAAALRLVQQKKLGLDDSIAQHLPDVPKAVGRSPCGICCSTRQAFPARTRLAAATTSSRCCHPSSKAVRRRRRARASNTGTRAMPWPAK